MQEPSIKFCPACGAQNRIGAQFCQACGSQAPAIQATPVIQKQLKKKNGIALLIICGVAVFGCAGLTALISAVRSNKNVGSTSFATPTPVPTSAPVLPPAEHLAAAKKLLAQPYSRDNYNEAMIHVTAIPEGAKEYQEAMGLLQKIADRHSREEAANAPPPDTAAQLTVVKSNWERDGFGAIAMWRVTFRNDSDRPIGDIQYRTLYYSETGNLVDKGGVDSPLDKKIIQKVIPPKSTRTVEVNDGFLHKEAHRARFQLVGCRFVTDSR